MVKTNGISSGGNSPPPSRGKLALILIFLSLFLVLAGLAVIFPYEYRDSDSSAYHSISSKLAGRPLAEWIRPEWWGHGGNEGLFRDHPPGIFWLPAVFVRLGVPGRAAPLCANFLYMLLLLLALWGLGRRFAGLPAAWGAVFAFILTPIFVQYLMRANHELPLALAVTAGIFALSRSGESPRFWALYGASLLMAVFIKGLSALALTLASLALWALVARTRKTLLVILAGHALALAAALGFEALYKSAAGESFWLYYFGFQGGKAVEAGFRPIMKLYNLTWYLSRILWFSAPWSLVLLYRLIRSLWDKSRPLRDAFMKFALAASGLVVLLFSLFDRKADRYIFPAYVLLTAAAASSLTAGKGRWRRLFEREPVRLALVLGAILVALTLLRIYFHTYHYRFIRLWAQ